MYINNFENLTHYSFENCFGLRSIVAHIFAHSHSMSHPGKPLMTALDINKMNRKLRMI